MGLATPRPKAAETAVNREKEHLPKIRGSAEPRSAGFHRLRIHREAEKGRRPLAGMNGHEGAKYYMTNRKKRVQLCFRVNSQIAATKSFYVSWFAGGVKNLHQV